jgi:hypothetical protein
MNMQETSEIRELTAEEMEIATGAFLGRLIRNGITSEGKVCRTDVLRMTYPQ